MDFIEVATLLALLGSAICGTIHCCFLFMEYKSNQAKKK